MSNDSSTHLKATIVTQRQIDINKKQDKYNPKGFGLSHQEEMVPEFHYGDVEKIRWESGYNSFIVLGKDRPSHRFSGAGGTGETQCGMIDLVAGRIGSSLLKNPKLLEGTSEGGKIYVGNNFIADSARVYITQKAKNVDKYLGFANKTHKVNDLSAVIIKSDCTRIVGRESVRIYTGSSKTGEGLGESGEMRSNNTPIESARIELVGGGNEDDLQPAVLGKNLVEFLKKNNTILTDNLRRIIFDIIMQLTEHSATLAVLTLGSSSALAAKNAVMNAENIMASLADSLNEKINNINYLNLGTIPGTFSILSNKVYIT